MITRPWSGDGLPGPGLLRSAILEHLSGAERLNRLRDYYDGRCGIRKRRRADGLPNNRLTHGFPRYISTMAAGYLIGSPVRYALEEGVEERHRRALSEVTNAYRRCGADSVDAELARDASVYGRGVELLFADGEARPRTVALDPRCAFVVYDSSAQARPLCGVHISARLDETGAGSGFSATVYARDGWARYGGERLDAIDWEAPLEAGANPFPGVPMIEYWNDEDERGDFEGVLSLIDAYDLLESDRMNDKQQFVDALLLLYGCTMETDERGRSPGQQLREDKALVLPDSGARAEWLCKQSSEADTEVLRAALLADIHKMSMVPDMTDEAFSGNVSGVAMRYKLLGLEQLTRIKERWFREALRERLRLFSGFLEIRGAPPLPCEDVVFTFARSLPVNELEVAKTISELRGLVSDERLLKLAAFLGD